MLHGDVTIKQIKNVFLKPGRLSQYDSTLTADETQKVATERIIGISNPFVHWQDKLEKIVQELPLVQTENHNN